MGAVNAPPAAMPPPAGSAAAPPSPAIPPRRQLLRFVLAAALAVALLTPPALLIGRPPTTPQITIIGTGSINAASGIVGDDAALSLLLEGAGGGRVLIGGGASGADLPAALARTAPPWRDRLDLLLVTDARDLPGATELVRRGRVGQVATVGLDNEHDPALVALRERCAASGVPLRAVAAGERIAIGRDNALSLDVRPGAADDAPALSVRAGGISLAIIGGAASVAEAPTLALVPHGTVERYRAALASGPQLLIAPIAPSGDAGTATAQLLLVPPGQRSAFTVVGTTLHLRGGTPAAFPDAPR